MSKQQNKNTGTLAEQLARASGRGKPFNNGTRNNANFRDEHLPPIPKTENDGVDHINMNDRGATELGQFLGITNTALEFSIGKLGKFKGLYNLWFWMVDPDHSDIFRKASFNVLKHMSNNLKKRLSIRHFYVIMLTAAYNRIKANKPLMDALIESDLPLDFYLAFKDTVPTRPVYAGWFINGHEEIRAALKEGREPDFSKWADRDAPKGEDIFAHIYELVSLDPSTIKAIAASNERDECAEPADALEVA